ncbi:hypothetical protein [Candidatus Mesenet endosymbiont of Phosphuga atrata]|uniref:hypothetical protein n=1 Tax=Candidatus Mesenet endosymbiont of Phosphuga atrata TaxID=3066221 RepID=UPI0030CAD789
MKTSSCNANIFSKHPDIQKYIPLEITKGKYIATTKNPYDQLVKNYEANIELNDEIIGTFSTQWYFYYGDQFGMNDFYSRGIKNIEQIPLGKDGDIFLKVVKVENDDYNLAICDENGVLSANPFLIDKKHFPTLENNDLKQHANENISFIVKKGHVMKDKTGKEVEVDGKSFFTADFYRINDQTKPIGELYCGYGIYADIDDRNISSFYYHYWPADISFSISDKNDLTLALFNDSNDKYPYYLGLTNLEGRAYPIAGIGHLDKTQNVGNLFNIEKSVCENLHSNTTFNTIPESFVTDFAYI